MEDVTKELIRDAESGPGPKSALVARAKPAKTLTPSLVDALQAFALTDGTMGYISKALAYSRLMPSQASKHAALIRLIKGGHIRVYRVKGEPPTNSTAKRDSPWSSEYYVLRTV